MARYDEVCAHLTELAREFADEASRRRLPSDLPTSVKGRFGLSRRQQSTWFVLLVVDEYDHDGVNVDEDGSWAWGDNMTPGEGRTALDANKRGPAHYGHIPYAMDKDALRKAFVSRLASG
jgi:hypothetical protein